MSQILPPVVAAENSSPSVWVAFATSIGWMCLLDTPNGISQLCFGYDDAAAAKSACQATAALTSEAPWHPETVEQLKAYANGSDEDFSQTPLLWAKLTDFQRAILQACQQIPFGQTATYRELAEQAGRPRAARAVGQVMARNHWPILIPCHRVLQSGGKLGGYSAPRGLEQKRELLNLEGVSLS